MLDKFGFPQGVRTPEMLADIERASGEVQSLKEQWTKSGFGLGEIEEFSNSFVRDETLKGLMGRVAAATSPSEPATGRPELEGEAVHIVSAGDVKLEKFFKKKIPLAKPDDPVNSAIKGMQIVIENLSNELNDGLQSLGNYADASTRPQMDFDKLIESAAESNSKYMKVIFNKMNEFTNKTLSAELSSTIAHLPATKRSMFADMKQVLNANTLQQYSGISNGIGGMLKGVLKQSLNIDSLVEQALTKANNPLTPTSNAFFRSWVPGIMVEKGDKLSFRNSIFTVQESGRTGLTLPNLDVENQINGGVQLAFDSYVEGDGANDGTGEVLYGDTRTHPTVPICFSEDVIGQAIAGSRDAIETANNNIVNGMNSFIGDMESELKDVEQAAKPKARDASLDGAVLGITDEEGLGNNQGGSYYVTSEDVGTIEAGNVTNRGVGIASTAPGGGLGLTVDITVSEGGATGTTDGETWIKFLTGGSGYNDGASPTPSTTGTNTNQNTTGGSGTGCKANITYASGVGTKVTITECQGGTGYKKGDVITITGANGGSGCQFEIIKPRGRIDQFGLVLKNRGRGYSTGDLITVFRETYCSTPPDATFTATQTSDPGQVAMDPPNSGKNKPQGLGNMLSKLGGMSSSLTSALDFKNIVGNVFPFEVPPIPAVSDFYTLGEGGGSLPDSQKPSLSSIAKTALGSVGDLPIPKEVEFAKPPKITESLSNIASSVSDQLNIS
tara:strand:+ start:5714 stop:7894 length:2181 start_codon:yes stop_codon:yes gene_type:complete